MPADSFQSEAKQVVKNDAKKPAKSMEALRKILATPEIKARGIKLGYISDKVLKRSSLIPAYEKLLTARESKLKAVEVDWIADHLTPENSKYLDTLLEPEKISKAIRWKNLGVNKIAKVMMALSQLEKPRLIEILSDKKLTFKGVLKTIQNEETFLGLKLIKNPKIKKLSKHTFDGLKYFDAERYLNYSDLGYKMQNVEDKKIKTHVNSELALLQNKKGFQIQEKLYSLECLLDAYHVAKGNYSLNDGELSSYYQSFGQIWPKGKEYLNARLQNLKTPAGQKAVKNINRNFVIDFKKQGRLEGLKKYILENQKTNPNMADYIYEKYYLNTLTPKAKQEHLKIMNEFGTKLFYVNNPKAPTCVYNELSQWKKAGGNDFVAPHLIDLSRLREK